MHDLGADTPAPHEQALVDERLDGLADGGPGQAEPRGQLDLVAEQAAGGEGAVLDRRLELLRQLEVQRHGAAAIHAQVQRHGGIHFWFRHGPSVAPRAGDGKLCGPIVRTYALTGHGL